MAQLLAPLIGSCCVTSRPIAPFPLAWLCYMFGIITCLVWLVLCLNRRLTQKPITERDLHSTFLVCHLFGRVPHPPCLDCGLEDVEECGSSHSRLRNGLSVMANMFGGVGDVEVGAAKWMSRVVALSRPGACGFDVVESSWWLSALGLRDYHPLLISVFPYPSLCAQKRRTDSIVRYQMYIWFGPMFARTCVVGHLALE